MRLISLAYKNLYRRRIRTLLTIGGVGVAVAVLVSLLGFNQGYREALEKDVGGLGYEVLITAKGCPYELATVAIQGECGTSFTFLTRKWQLIAFF